MKEKAMFGGSVAAAIVASLCCLGPLVATALGLGAFGLAGSFEALRPYLLGLTALLLAGAFYVTYRKREAQCSEGGCEVSTSGRASKAAAWIGTIAVIAFAAFPYYGGALLNANGLNKGGPQAGDASATISVAGMSCGGCAVTLERELAKVPGVKSARVSYEQAQAVVAYDLKRLNLDDIRNAIEQSGYKPAGSATSTVDHSPGAAGMRAWNPDELRDAFNGASGSVRVVAILSPTCPACQRGGEVVKTIFAQLPSDHLKGFVVYLPMLQADDAAAARVQGTSLQDARIEQGWDAERGIGRRFAKTLKLRVTAWDVYLIYPPGIKWEGDEPPPAGFWMHQLGKLSGADRTLCLNPAALTDEVRKALTAIP